MAGLKDHPIAERVRLKGPLRLLKAFGACFPS